MMLKRHTCASHATAPANLWVGFARGSILHLMGWDQKFVPSFIQFVGENFDLEKHRFIVHGLVKDGDLPEGRHVIYLPHLLRYAIRIMAEMRYARKIIIHGLFSSHLLYLLTLQPWVLKKCYWTIWGGDLYSHNADRKDWRWMKNEWLRRFVISRLGHLITHVRGDYDLAQKWYGAKGVWHECFMYPSNLYHELPIQPTPHVGINILLGNSADPCNNHIDALDKLKLYANKEIKIFCPLSYGDPEYAKTVSDYGYRLFGDNFNPLFKFIGFEDYKRLLARIDIAIFNHMRQQGMGNITTLLGMGKKIFMRSDVTSYHAIRSLGAIVFDVDCFDLLPLEVEQAKNNKLIISDYFSKNRLVQSWQVIFEG